MDIASSSSEDSDSDSDSDAEIFQAGDDATSSANRALQISANIADDLASGVQPVAVEEHVSRSSACKSS
jgi:hypothetical protein